MENKNIPAVKGNDWKDKPVVSDVYPTDELLEAVEDAPPLEVSHERMERYFASINLEKVVKYFFDRPHNCGIMKEGGLSADSKREYIRSIITDCKSRRVGIRELFAMMKGAYVIKGKLGFEATVYQELIKLSGLYSRPYYEEVFDDNDELLRIRMYVFELATEKRLNGVWVKKDMIDKMNWNSNVWKGMPEVMMRHRAMTLLARQTLGVLFEYDTFETMDITGGNSAEAQALSKRILDKELGGSA